MLAFVWLIVQGSRCPWSAYLDWVLARRRTFSRSFSTNTGEEKGDDSFTPDDCNAVVVMGAESIGFEWSRFDFDCFALDLVHVLNESNGLV